MNTTKMTSNSTKTASATFFACDHIGKRIYGSVANFKKSETFGTAQYEALMVLMERYPNYSLDAIAPDVQKQSYKGLNFELMMNYVEFKGSAVQKAEFEEIVNRNSTFPVIKSWFVENFKAGFTVEKAKSEIAAAKRKIAQETLKATKAKHKGAVAAGETANNITKEITKMSKIELLAKIELLNKYEAMIEEMKNEADTIRNSIKAEMEAREVEEMIAGQYIICYR